MEGPRPIPIGALERYTLISQSKRSGFAQDINRWLSHQGMAAANLTADNLLAVVGLVTAGRGISILPKLCVQRFAREQGLEVLETTPRLPTIGYYALYHGGVRIRLLEELALRLAGAADFTRPFFVSKKHFAHDFRGPDDEVRSG